MSFQQQYRPQGFKLLPTVTKNLLIINFLFYLATFALNRAFQIDLVTLLGLHYPKSENFRIWQLVTYMFMHSPTSFTHILFNMFAVWMFGTAIENYWSGKRFLNYYLITGIGAGLIQLLVTHIRIQMLIPAGESQEIYRLLEGSVEVYNSGQMFNNPLLHKISMLVNTTTVGASGSVFGILLAFGMLFPNSLIYIYFAIPVKAKYFVIGYGLLELYSGFANREGDNIAHFAHLGGMIFGFILIKIWQKNINRPQKFY